MGPATVTAAAAAPNQRYQSLDQAQTAASDRTVGLRVLLLHKMHAWFYSHWSCWCTAGVYPTRARRKCTAERRGGGVCESGSDSGSSSGSVRASRGSWGSWSSTSSVEGDRDAGARTHPCTTSSRKSRNSSKLVKQNHRQTPSLLLFSLTGESVYSITAGERDCYRDAMNANYKTLK